MTSLATRPIVESTLVAAAAAGDSAAFDLLAHRHRPALHAHCRRMLRTPVDADDAVQETLLRAWRRLGTFEGRSTFGWWLRTIATNTCIEQIRRRARADAVRRATLDERGGLEADAGAAIADLSAVLAEREAVERAYLWALRALPERQCAVLVLRAVLRYSAAETAALVGSTVAAVNSALQRANATLADVRPAADPARESRPATSAERDLVRRLVDAQQRADAEAVVAALGRSA